MRSYSHSFWRQSCPNALGIWMFYWNKASTLHSPQCFKHISPLSNIGSQPVVYFHIFLGPTFSHKERRSTSNGVFFCNTRHVNYFFWIMGISQFQQSIHNLFIFSEGFPQSQIPLVAWGRDTLTLPETIIAPARKPSQKETSQPSFFRCLTGWRFPNKNSSETNWGCFQLVFCCRSSCSNNIMITCHD